MKPFAYFSLILLALGSVALAVGYEPVFAYRNTTQLVKGTWLALGATLPAEVDEIQFYNGPIGPSIQNPSGTIMLGEGTTSGTAGTIFIFGSTMYGRASLRIPKGAQLWLMSPDVTPQGGPSMVYINGLGGTQF